MKEGKASRAMGHLDDELILSAMDEADTTGARRIGQNRRHDMKKTAVWKRWVAMAAAFALLLTGGIFIGRIALDASRTTVALDVNPSIEIEVNSKEKIKEVEALNKEAETVLAGLSLEGKTLDEGMDLLLGSMLKHGFLTGERNSILLSVDTKSATRATELKNKLSGEISEKLEGSNIKASVITQDFEHDRKTDKHAEQHAISPARATLIAKIVASGLLDANGVPYSYESLAKLKVHELKLILDARAVRVAGIDAWGTAATGTYLTAEEAVTLALTDAGFTRESTHCVSSEIDFDDDRATLVYEVELCTGDTKHEYEIHATTGAILEKEIEQRHGGHADNKSESTVLPEGAITREKALEIALADASLGRADVYRPKIEVDTEAGVTVFEVEFKYQSNEYEYTIHALTGEILEREVEAHH